MTHKCSILFYVQLLGNYESNTTNKNVISFVHLAFVHIIRKRGLCRFQVSRGVKNHENNQNLFSGNFCQEDQNKHNKLNIE